MVLEFSAPFPVGLALRVIHVCLSRSSKVCEELESRHVKRVSEIWEQCPASGSPLLARLVHRFAMEWSNSRFQPPSTQSSFLQQQSLRPARPRYWYGNGDEDDAQETQHPDTMLQPSRYADDSALATPPSLPSLKTEISNNENGGTLLQSFSSLGMPQLEEATEFQPFFSAQNNGLSDNAFLQPTQQHPPALVPEQPQQTDQLQSQFSPQFGQFPSGMASYYAPTVPPAPSPPLAATRSSVDYFHEGMKTLKGHFNLQGVY
ncbi:unnamed protein product [Phytophthora lilii]|uniref:Unnamed protein product n=1 Tax=Phytophthora lilii TaxID=2077276 RepID=A0A9W6WTU4_9STRA|nr:unnamed protein product [Phytophthora lilii]